MPYLDALRPEMRPSVSEVPLVPWLPLVGLLGMPAMILPPLPCSSSFGLLPHTGVMHNGISMQILGQSTSIHVAAKDTCKDLEPHAHSKNSGFKPSNARSGWRSHCFATAALSASNRDVLSAIRQAWAALFAQLLVHVGLQHIHAPWPGVVVALLSLHRRHSRQHSRQLPLFLCIAPTPHTQQ